MPKYYDQVTNEEIKLIKVKEPFAKVKGFAGEILVTQGNYYAEYPDGNIVAVHADDLDRYYQKSKNKEVEKQQAKTKD